MFPFEAYRIWIFRTRFKREIPEKWRNLSHRPHNGPVGSFMSLPEEVEEGREIRSIETEVPVIVHLWNSVAIAMKRRVPSDSEDASK